MAKVIYAAWDGEVIDNRSKKLFEIEDTPEFAEFGEFDAGNPIKAFVGGKGFFVFEKDVNLLETALSYLRRVAKESCGKCTPCRMGSHILVDYLESLLEGRSERELLDEIRLLADHINSTSLCGIGMKAGVALRAMIEHFREELEKDIGAGSSNRAHHCTSYVTAPCIEECPSKVDVPRYIDYIKDGKFTHSVGVVLQKYPMAATCGRVCVRFCEMACQRTQVDEAVGIKVLKRFVADKQKYVTGHWFTPELITDKKPDDLKVAIIGSGPAGISAAYHLLLKGYPVEVFEAMTEPGGMAAVGIPEYRLPKEEILRKEVSIIESLGGVIHYNQRLGQHFTLDDLKTRGFQATFLGVGAHLGKGLGIPGEERSVAGYVTGVKFLQFINHYHLDLGLPMELGERMVVVGGGNVAMDCVRSALRMGVKDVHVIYRRTRDSMPADLEEIEAAEAEGIHFHFLTHPTRLVTKDGRVQAIELVEMEQGEPDASGRRSVRPKEDSHYLLECDFVIPAIGQAVDPSFTHAEDGVELNRWGLIKADETTLETDRPGVFAGGDAVTGPATLIQAMALGERAARSIDDYLSYGRVKFDAGDRMSQLLRSIRKLNPEYVDKPVKHIYRVKAQELDPEVRKRIFEEVEKPISTEEAYAEASRCMRCYRVYTVVTEK
jgi:formate dehydrogenase beta subunit